jgi:glycosyltransferase involved in cell wall biosynthesis
MYQGNGPRVLLVLTEVFANGGIQRFNQTILDACHQLGITCRILSLLDSANVIDAQVSRGNESITGFSGNRLKFSLAVIKAVLRQNHDYVLIGHINLLTLVVAALRLRPVRRAQTLMIAHGIEVWGGIGRARRYALRQVDKILCVSHYTRLRILEQAPALHAERLHIFPNALAGSWTQIEPSPPPPLESGPFILSVTRLDRGDRYKGIVSVIEAFGMVEDTSLQYLIAGQGDDMPFLRVVAERCNVGNRVHFMGRLSDSQLVSLYQKCEAFVLPSGKEGFGIVYLEAMYFGAPVIAAQEKGAVDVVQDGITGITVAFGDTIAIKEAIECVRTDAPLRETLRSNGRSVVTDDGAFTFRSFTQRCAEAFGCNSAAWRIGAS